MGFRYASSAEWALSCSCKLFNAVLRSSSNCLFFSFSSFISSVNCLFACWLVEDSFASWAWAAYNLCLVSSSYLSYLFLVSFSTEISFWLFLDISFAVNSRPLIVSFSPTFSYSIFLREVCIFFWYSSFTFIIEFAIYRSWISFCFSFSNLKFCSREATYSAVLSLIAF